MSSVVEASAVPLGLEDRDGELHVFIPAAIDPRGAEALEESVWERMHFASHLRTERLGEYTIGTDLRRSETLAIVQVLILYHLVTARASVALGGVGVRRDGVVRSARRARRSRTTRTATRPSRRSRADAPCGSGAPRGRARGRRGRGRRAED